MRRDSLHIDGFEYVLSHLNPFTVDVSPSAVDAATYKVLVTFGHHTFTRTVDFATDSASYHYSEGGDLRCFCPDRFYASQGLPSLIASAVRGKAYFSQNRNYMLIDQPLGGAPYAVFFNLEKTRSVKGLDASMFVVSAYEKPGLPAKSRLPSISFATLVAKTARGEPITRPKK